MCFSSLSCSSDNCSPNKKVQHTIHLTTNFIDHMKNALLKFVEFLPVFWKEVVNTVINIFMYFVRLFLAFCSFIMLKC
jgi:hypothetical protein